MPSFHDIHHSIPELCHTNMAIHYIIYIYIYIYIYIIYLNISSIPKQLQIIQGQPSNQTTHCLAQFLAQAKGSRSGEPSSLRRGLEKEIGTNAGSRLGETPLAWVSGSLTQNNELVAWATFREKGFGRASARLA